MNVEKILEIADLIESQPHTEREADEGFCMSSTVHDCGTPACIAGWVEWDRIGRPEEMFPLSVYIGPQEYLGITYDQAKALFEPQDYQLNQYTPAQAATTLRKLAETGEVDWSHCDE